VRTFLRGGSGSLKLDEEVTVEVSRTYWTTWQGVRPISSPLMHMEGSLSPSWSEATCVGRSYSDEPVGGPPSAQGRFGQRPLAEDPIYRGTTSRCGEGVIHGVGRVAPPLFQLPLAGGRRSRRGMRPSPFCYPSDGSLFSLSLLSCLCFFTGGVSHLPPYDICGWVDIPWLTKASPKTLRKIASAVK
jgi:hypothetical protein